LLRGPQLDIGAPRLLPSRAQPQTFALPCKREQDDRRVSRQCYSALEAALHRQRSQPARLRAHHAIPGSLGSVVRGVVRGSSRARAIGPGRLECGTPSLRRRSSSQGGALFPLCEVRVCCRFRRNAECAYAGGRLPRCGSPSSRSSRRTTRDPLRWGRAGRDPAQTFR
jgi:hypothetical protein